MYLSIQFRVSLPQIVQEYIQSQLSLSLQQQQQQQSQIQAKLSSSINPLSNNSHPCTSIDQMICSPSALSKLVSFSLALCVC
ncbi:unnamed protein product [Trichobilharzia regenti]|nr:unnamed protein product [Trichobilharzia regenti]